MNYFWVDVPQISAELSATTEYVLMGAGPESGQTAAPKGSGLPEEFAKLFTQLTPEDQNEIIAEMLKRQRRGK